LIFGSKNRVGLRTAFGWEPVAVGFDGGGLLGGSAALFCKGGGIEAFGDAGWGGRIGAGEDGAENRDDGESRIWPVSLRGGVAGYEKLEDAPEICKDDD